ncbi:SpoIIAA family protein [Rufibacter roseus]|uniref:STAS/SEC14 domain-containing protein n=1 Tax=Rufibacter roseus TaxID=1567108 RepID=A0ABW2DLX5_9BACT|nr:STAS/SEC14 domain-containing protein [Rufibacter roseus]
MVEIKETDDPKVFAVKVSGTLGKEEYDILVPALETRISQQGKINLYWEFENFDGWKPDGLWEDLKFDVQHVTDFDKIAIVGGKKWEQTITQLMKPFTTAEVKYFEHEERDEAREFVGL